MKCRHPIVIHYVYDMQRAKNFYTSLFKVKPRFESAGWSGMAAL